MKIVVESTYMSGITTARKSNIVISVVKVYARRVISVVTFTKWKMKR